MTLLDAVKLAFIVATPTLIGGAIIYLPRWSSKALDRWRESRHRPPQPCGAPIEQLAADLRRLLRLHSELTMSPDRAMCAHRLRAVEAAIGDRAIEAAAALELPHPERPATGTLTRLELSALLAALAESGLVLPPRVGPFTADGRL